MKKAIKIIIKKAIDLSLKSITINISDEFRLKLYIECVNRTNLLLEKFPLHFQENC